jgi:hypothetical protein
VNCFTLDLCEGAYGDVFESQSRQTQRRPAVKTFITALTLVFVLATGTSMIALTVHTDRAHIGQDNPYGALHQKMALLY